MLSAAHTATFSITGMSCGHCERAIRAELHGLPQLTVAELSAASGVLVVTSDGEVPTDLVRAAVIEAGYDATLVSAR